MTTLIMPIIETIIKSSVILGFAFFATLLLRRQSAACRHTVWTAGLICALALPFFSLVLPAWQVESIRAVRPSPGVIASQPMAAESGPVVVAAPTVVDSTPSWLTTERALLLVWTIGVLSIASLLFREAVRLARVAFGARTIEQPSWRELVREVSHALTLTRRVRLMRNPNASVLGTWGTLRPRVLLPRESESWSDERLRVVLGHELAHVKRNDWLIQIIAETARATYWFNPLFWIACTELRRESEHACDDAAMNLGGSLQIDGPTYAGHVLDLARTLKHSGQPAAAALAMASTSNLERRLIAMLNPSLNRSITSKGTAVIIVLLALGLTLPLAAVSSQAPVPAVSEIQAVQIVSPTPIPAAASAVAAVPVASRPVPRSVALAAPTSPAVEAVQPAVAQNQSGTLSGRVSDPSGAVIPGVRVTLTAQASLVTRSIFTNDSGNFAFTQLPPDNYSGTVDLPGFQPAKFTCALTDPGSSARFNVTLPISRMFTVVDISVGLRPGGPVVTDTAAPRPMIESPVDPPPTATVVSGESQAAIPVTGQGVPIRVGGNIQVGNLISHPNPAYPSEARLKGIEGVVILSGAIGEDGHLRNLKIVSSSNPLLETSVLETIQNWTYRPTQLNGQPVEVLTTITLNFTFSR